MISRAGALFLGLLRVPLLYKILLFNCATTSLLVLVGVVVATEHVKAWPVDAHHDLAALFLIASISVSLAVGFLVLKLVLSPLNQLETAADDALQGKQHLVESSSVSDARLDQLTAAFNGMQNTLEDNAQRMRGLSKQIVYAQEAERQRIARQLHDEIAQTLTSVLLYLKLLEKSNTPQEAQRIQNLRKLITHALSDIRQLAVELHPKMLDDWGLEAVLGQRVDELNADGSKHVTLQIEGRSPERLPRDLELTFYHVAQEALNNVVHHSHARCARISLKREENFLTLEVQDDGVGFNPDVMRTGRASSFGLASMRERLALVGGDLMIESRPGVGTRVFVRAPMSRVASQEEVPLHVSGSRSN